MKEYSEFTKEYVTDICTVLQAKGVIADNLLNKPFEPESFETLTDFLQGHIIYSSDIFTYLDNLGLVNRGKCPYTGQRTNDSSTSWSIFGRKVYLSNEGKAIMRKEDDEEYIKTYGHPRPEKNKTSSKGGCYIATACYGDEFAPEVLTLKVFRDNVLSKNIFGRLFIKTYYFFSPSIAEKLKDKETINTFIREKILDNIVRNIK